MKIGQFKTQKFEGEEIKRFISKPIFDERSILSKDPAWPKVSVVTPSFNQTQFLEKTILSVLNQNYPNLEYIIIDGGSTDGSVEIIKKYEKYLAYWVSEKDDGQADAIGKGFMKATGEILAWLNSDDYYLPGTLHRVAREFKQANYDLIYGDEILVDENDVVIGRRPQLPPPGLLTPALITLGGFWIYQPASFWKAELYKRVGGVDRSFQFCMDNDLFIKFVLAGARLHHVKQYFTAFRYHSTSKSCSMIDVGQRERKQLSDKYRSKIPFWLNDPRLTQALGHLYLLRHLTNGTGWYLCRRIMKKFGTFKGQV